MLSITIPEQDLWDEVHECFIPIKEQTLRLEHSLVSLSKWEAKWHVPFLDKNREKTLEEKIDYIKFMTITQNVNPIVYNGLTMDNVNEINKYIDDPMTATTFPKIRNERPNRETITSELIYYWMITLRIPIEFQKWHVNRLMTLIRVCEIKNRKPKKMSQRELMSRNSALNAARKKQLHTKG